MKTITVEKTDGGRAKKRKYVGKPFTDNGYVMFKNIDKKSNMFRYYILFDEEPTMFSDIYSVKIVYGRIHKTARYMYKLFGNIDDARKYKAQCYKKRLQHGYVKTNNMEVY